MVLAALQDLDDSAQEQRMVLPAYMRDKSMGVFTKVNRMLLDLCLRPDCQTRGGIGFRA